eukprot:TRINITY_DN2269_c0_g1_i2.p1 TRINITY_DN2269_c0_g1~~TRINITY_DN2269_c0_g1_i2.p1  ORF type:complete len:1054 (+),score=430.50 TRINITY_DN2269_c0_g1_i2:224-3385(+)
MEEKTTLVELIKTDVFVNKVLLVFTNNCLEIKNLVSIAKKEFYAPLTMFGTVTGGAATDTEGEAQNEFSKVLPFLGRLSDFVTRCYAITKNVVHQMASLYRSSSKLYQSSFKNVRLEFVFESLGNLFGMLITLDELISRNSSWNHSLTLYQRMIKTMKPDPSKFNIEEKSLWKIESSLFSIKSQLLDGMIYQNCISQQYNEDVLDVSGNKEFKKEFWTLVKSMFDRFTAKLTVSEEDSITRNRFLPLTSLYVFYVILFKDLNDKKFLKNVWDTHKKVPLIHLFGDVAWFPTTFLVSTVPAFAKVIGNTDVLAFQKNLAQELAKEFPNRVKFLYIQISSWMVKMESNLNHQGDTESILKNRAFRLLQGVKLAMEASELFKETILLHSSKNIPLKAFIVGPACQLIEMIKAIQLTFQRRVHIVAESLTFMIQQAQFQLQKIFFNVQARLESGKKFSDAKLDSIAALSLITQMLNGCASAERRTIIKLAMFVVFQPDFLKNEEVEGIRNIVQELDLLCEWEDNLRAATNCNFFYWSRSMLPIYLSDLYQKPHQAYRMQYLFAALRDIIPTFQQALHLDTQLLYQNLKSQIDEALHQYILTPLCIDVETDLRFHVHSHLAVIERNPIKSGVKDLSQFFNIKPIRYFDQMVHFKAYVEHYLDKTFYNHTTVALNDWKTYGEMRNLAQEKYGLELTEVHLPGQTLEQGIDVLEVTKNIHVFVGRYNYNLNNQIFVERATEKDKILNVININHISNSIRTHGVGIMNTTVNFIYQFLKQKFVIFSQFLFDDHIKARLYRDIRYFKENREKLNNKYPMERAVQFNKEIKKLGLTDQKQSYLDQFRNLITEIGNAMGYIRMIRSGGFGYISNAIKFVPDLQDILNFEEMSKNLSPESIQASKNLDGAIDSLAKNFAEGTEYFQMLVTVFAEEFRSEENSHLKNFHAIIPPLAINFVDHILSGKDKLSKKKNGGFFTDDGFAIGVAYILKLLDQVKQFESLHWFETVSEHYDAEMKTLQQQMSKQKKEEQQASLLTHRKIKGFQTEFELFHYSLSGASIFFKQ